MAIITGGYDGTVDEVQFAGLLPRYSVAGPDDFKATTQAGDRILAIGNGTALGPGTIDVASNLPTIQFAVASGTRWDLVALRRDWQPPGGTSEIKIIQGGASEAYPAVGTATTAWNRRPGIVDDQPLYLQQVTGTLLGTRIDLRCWQSNSGLVAVHDKARTYLETLGTEVLIGGLKWNYVPGANGVPAWRNDDAVMYSPIQIPGYSITGGITVEPAGSRTHVTVDINVTRTGNAGLIPKDDWANFGAVIPTPGRGPNVEPKYLPVVVVGGLVSTAQNNLHASVVLNPASGVMQIRGLSDFTWQKGALFSLNTDYYI